MGSQHGFVQNLSQDDMGVRIKISVNTDLSIIRFYGFIDN